MHLTREEKVSFFLAHPLHVPTYVHFDDAFQRHEKWHKFTSLQLFSLWYIFRFFNMDLCKKHDVILFNLILNNSVSMNDELAGLAIQPGAKIT